MFLLVCLTDPNTRRWGQSASPCARIRAAKMDPEELQELQHVKAGSTADRYSRFLPGYELFWAWVDPHCLLCPS